MFLFACDAGERKPPPAPFPKPVPTVPADAAVVTIDASTIPTPANRNLRIDARVKSEPDVAECERNTLSLRLVDKAKQLVDDFEETSTCSGACTPQEKREGAAMIRAIEKRIEADEGSPSELDYNFTACQAIGFGEHRKFRNVGGRDVVVFTNRYIGPHDTIDHGLRVAFEVCGKLFVSESFAEHMYSSWGIDEITPKAEGDGALSFYGASTQQGTLMRAHLPPCPGVPRIETFDIHPTYEL